VGQYAANPWGFFDMHGNVSEWTLEKVFLLSDNPHYITKGGGFDDGSHWMRSAGRVASPPDFRNAGLGFRVSFQKQ
jgi:formylglycine-generating enzyme required for sulfatase activity